MTGFVAYFANNIRKLIRIYLSLGNYIPLTLSYDCTYGVRVWNDVAGANQPLERLEYVSVERVSVNVRSLTIHVRELYNGGCSEVYKWEWSQCLSCH